MKQNTEKGNRQYIAVDHTRPIQHSMKRAPPIQFIAAAAPDYAAAAIAALIMSSRHPYRGSPTPWRRNFSSDAGNGGIGQFVTGDSHFQSVREANLGMRQGGVQFQGLNPTAPPYNQYQKFRHPPPQYNQNQHHPPQCNQNQHPPPPYTQNQQFRHPLPFYQNQEFRPAQQYRPPPTKPLDYRSWEYAKVPPASDCERFLVVSYNILADYLAINHRSKLYYHIPRYILDWQWRKRSIIFELGLWSADIMCLQEVDRFQEIYEELNLRGYSGIWKMRTGDPIDGCAIFWRASRFKLLHEESIEFNKLGLRDNVAQLCVLELTSQNMAQTREAPPTGSTNSNKVVICNIHVLYNPRRGEIKVGQLRILLDKAYAISRVWDGAPVVLCGDFNCTPKSPLYNFICEQKLDLSGLDRDKVSGQVSAQIHAPIANNANDRTHTSYVWRNPNQYVKSPADAAPAPLLCNKENDDTVSGSITELQKQSDVEATKEYQNVINGIEDASGKHNLDAVDSSMENSTDLHSGAVDENINSQKSHDLNVPSVFSNNELELDDKMESSSKDELEESIEEVKEMLEESSSFLASLHNAEDSLSPGFAISEELTSDPNSGQLQLHAPGGEILQYNNYDPSAWTPMEIATATGEESCTVLEHPLQLKSAYTEVEDCSGTRDQNGEPLVTSYNRCFLGTVDYIWHSEGLHTARVLAPISKQAMQWTPGFPTKKWGSDHIALAAELAFRQD